MNLPLALGATPCKRWQRAFLAVAVTVALLGSAIPACSQDIRLQGLRGERLTEDDVRQGTWIVVVWASWSPRSRGIADRINALAGRFSGKARVVTVNFQEDRAAVDGFLANGRLDVPVYLDSDGAFSKRFSISNLPGLLVLKGGEAAYRGKFSEDADQVLTDLMP